MVEADDTGVAGEGSLEESMDDVDVDRRNGEEEWILSREDSDSRGCRLQSLGAEWILNRVWMPSI